MPIGEVMSFGNLNFLIVWIRRVIQMQRAMQPILQNVFANQVLVRTCNLVQVHVHPRYGCYKGAKCPLQHQ